MCMQNRCINFCVYICIYVCASVCLRTKICIYNIYFVTDSDADKISSLSSNEQNKKKKSQNIDRRLLPGKCVLIFYSQTIKMQRLMKFPFHFLTLKNSWDRNIPRTFQLI